jgi:hypothetical protein
MGRGRRAGSAGAGIHGAREFSILFLPSSGADILDAVSTSGLALSLPISYTPFYISFPYPVYVSRTETVRSHRVRRQSLRTCTRRRRRGTSRRVHFHLRQTHPRDSRTSCEWVLSRAQGCKSRCVFMSARISKRNWANLLRRWTMRIIWRAQSSVPTYKYSDPRIARSRYLAAYAGGAAASSTGYGGSASATSSTCATTVVSILWLSRGSARTGICTGAVPRPHAHGAADATSAHAAWARRARACCFPSRPAAHQARTHRLATARIR